MLNIEMVPAAHGDCLWIEYGTAAEPHRVLIDGGTSSSYRALKARLEARLGSLPPAKRQFELLVITHIDADHIGGVLELLVERPFGVSFGDVWFNGWDQLPRPGDDQLGAVQGEQVSALIERRGLPWNHAFQGGAVVVPESGPLPRRRLPGGLELTLLSPTMTELARLRPNWKREVEAAGLVAGSPEGALERLRERRELPPDLLGEDDSLDVEALALKPFSSDSSAANAASIVVLAEFEGRKALLAADAFAGVLERTVARLKQERDLGRLALDAFKLPHHGSKHNVSLELLEQLRCERFLFSTNGQIFRHPDREAVARVITSAAARPALMFNYATERNRIWDDGSLKRRFDYETVYPGTGMEGLLVSL